MQEVFERIIGKLEELHERYINQYGVVGGNPMAFAVKECIDTVEEIVKQEAEKFVPDTNVGNNGWIPCSERLPEEHDSMFARFKGTDKWRDSMFEKTSSEVAVTIADEKGEKAQHMPIQQMEHGNATF